MIRAQSTGDGRVVLVLDEDRSTAFIDRDWLGAPETEVPALVIDGAAGASFRGRSLSGAQQDATATATSFISAVVNRVVRILERVGGGGIEVIGQGVTASEVRRRMAAVGSPDDQRPRAVVELTGDPDELARATGRVADGGLVIVGGETRDETPLNLYADIHRRGLRLMGLPEFGADGDPDPGMADLTDPGSVALPEPVSVRSGEPLPAGLWYRVTQ